MILRHRMSAEDLVCAMSDEQISVVAVAYGDVPETEAGSVWVVRGKYRAFEDPLPNDIPNSFCAFGPGDGARTIAIADCLVAVLRWLGYDVTDVGVGDD
jgi:hypothetical protein